MLAHLLAAAKYTMTDFPRQYRVANPRALSWLCVGGMALALATLIGMTPLRGQDANGLARQIDHIQAQQDAATQDVAALHLQLAELMFTQRQQGSDIADAKAMLTRTFLGIVGILGTIIYRTAVAFWALRAGWLAPREPKT